MRELWLGDRVDFEGEYYNDGGRLDLRRPRRWDSGLHRSRRSGRGPVRGRAG